MDDYVETLEMMAEKIGLPPQLLHDYLHEALSPAQKAMMEPRSRHIELQLTVEGDGVFYCLINKSGTIPQPPATAIDFIAPILQGIYEECVDSHYDLHYRATNHGLATEEYFRTLLNKYPDAGVLLLIPRRTETLASVCMEMNRPCLMIDYPNPAKLPIYTLNVDNCDAVYTQTQKLIALGHKRIAVITGRMDIASAMQRYTGYRSALKDASLPYDEDLVKYGNWRTDTAQKLTEELLALPNPPTAIVCTNDLSALGAYGAINSARLRIPEDISIVGFDDIAFVANIDPPLTTVRQPLKPMGRRAASILIDALEGHPSETFTHSQPLEVVWRESIGPAPK